MLIDRIGVVMNTTTRARVAIFGATLTAVLSLGIAAASPASAAACAAASPAVTTIAGAAETARTDAVASPQINVWSTFETNIGTEGKCESLLAKMKKAYPKSYKWECLPYKADVCPAQIRWELLYSDGE